MSKFTFLIALLVVVCGVTCTYVQYGDVEDAWQQYLKEYPLGIKTKAEYGKSKSNFERIHSIIEEHNADPKSTYQMGHNEFSVLDVEERKKYLLNNTLASTKSLYQELGFETGLVEEDDDLSTLRNLSSSVDYRNHRCMQPVKNQGACGSCSAFAATAVVEFAQCMKSGTPVNLSEQQIVDCDFADRRCGGGSYHEYWKSLIRAGGQAHSAGYPYVSGATKVRGPTCKNKSKGAKLAATNPIVALQKGDVNGVMRLLARGKVVAVCVGVTDKFMNYRSGVYTTPCKGKEGLHAIAAVGYGTSDGGTKYWIIRNSWGPKFGDAGYILFQRGINLCGVERDLATVNVA
ncbi:ervatamin-B-like [Daphnia pulicaria]|uniref:ervatamin-B-like n=1 Tax=Daphnia pulicaria TaxID=35523 RepID=UPI001EECB715|nr:ervatamin-B-like [Daphnia pulicaria]